MKKDDFMAVFRSSFPDGETWRNWFFATEPVKDENIYLNYDGTKAASALLMQPYRFLYEDTVLDTGYISCVATLPESRSKGLTRANLCNALRDARAKGYSMTELIPAEDHLYYFYSREGFATVFYVDRERYTSLHNFPEGRGTLVEPCYTLFHDLEADAGCGIMHSEEDYARVLEDMRLDGGDIVLAATDEDGHSAMLFATDTTAGEVLVKCLIGKSKYARRTLLCELRRRVGERVITVLRPPVSGDKALMLPYGMMRIVNPEIILGVLAARHQSLHMNIRLTDPLLEENSGLYEIAGGWCMKKDSAVTVAKIDLEISVDTLAAIVFGSHEMGEIFNIPSRRPYMALMLD